MPESYSYYTTTGGKVEKRWAQRATEEEKKAYETTMRKKGLVKVTFKTDRGHTAVNWIKRKEQNDQET